METAEVTFDIERSREIYKRYFAFERRRELKKFPGPLIYGISIALIITGWIFKAYFWTFFGLIVFGLVTVFLLVFRVRFQLAFNKFSKDLEKRAIGFEREFRFSFDNEEIIHESKSFSQKVNWSLISSYQENGKDLYLFLKNRELYDIISESIIGKEKFEKFRSILTEKVRRKD